MPWPPPDSPTPQPRYLVSWACGRAGDGNRTRIASLEGWNSAIELHPRRPNGTDGPVTPSGSERRRHFLDEPAERVDVLALARGAEGGHGHGGDPVPGEGADGVHQLAPHRVELAVAEPRNPVAHPPDEEVHVEGVLLA